jgi:hypothetical protein
MDEFDLYVFRLIRLDLDVDIIRWRAILLGSRLQIFADLQTEERHKDPSGTTAFIGAALGTSGLLTTSELTYSKWDLQPIISSARTNS